MKFLNFKCNVIIATLLMAFGASAQEKKTKVDGVIGVVGDYIILDSDIDKTYLELKQQGVETNDISRCQMLGKMLEDKLYAHQAIQDSIIVTDTEVNQKLDEQYAYMVEQLGSTEKVVQYFKKSSEEDLKTELFEIIKTNKLTAEMQRKIVDGVTITPEEVRDFFKRIPKDELPVFGAEMEVAQIVVKPVVSKEEEQKVIDQLKGFKKDILENGASFFSKAVLYTEDEGSRSTGGLYKMNRKTQFVKEFKDVAFSLQEGEISEPFKTEFGYHIIYLEKVRGQEIDVRHILLKPKVSPEAMKAAKEKIDLIRRRIVNKEISFAEAARTMSDEKETRNDGGVLTNPKTQDSRFELTKMDPSLYSIVANLKEGEVSLPMADEERAGGKFFKIMTVTNRFDEHTADYSKDYGRLKELALKEKQIKAIAKWSEEKIKETYVKINGEYRDCTFTNNWLKK
ncbi:peptidylprolyl isomerase [Flavobacterium amniphilum]|uniref:peptidylprolyl isomerase n=1 Tax=Flavobacterium amniphilum TaxID=1834035 RepID=UPI00202A3EF3|nr:peptidylprolyl isomerase [Flavobacterium amniphilum]MCL9806110.1 peptidylprolyl isomerase [Flavobacterium amniphilum]